MKEGKEVLVFILLLVTADLIVHFIDYFKGEPASGEKSVQFLLLFARIGIRSQDSRPAFFGGAHGTAFVGFIGIEIHDRFFDRFFWDTFLHETES